MADESPVPLDEVDWRILGALQRDGRISYTELAREVAMSASALTERVRRLEESGVIVGYRADIALDKVGLGILAYVRLRYPSGNYRPFERLVADTPEVLEAHHVTGEDCFLIRVAARSMRHLENVTGRLATLGAITTTVVYSSPLPRRDVTPAAAQATPPTAPSGSGSRRRKHSMAN
jgi:Lrp/AsnC family leucine-responsive transcriptional regulator